MFWKRLLPVLVVIAAVPSLVAESASNNANTADLNTVIHAVQSALDTYQRTSSANSLPPLKSAEFDFKTIVATSVTGKITLFIVTLGGTHEKDLVSDVTFLYAVPSAKSFAAHGAKKGQVSLQDQLVQTIRSAAEALKNAESFGNLPLDSLAVTVQYCVKNDVNGGGTVTAPFVTANIGADKNRSTVQSVRLVFSR